MTPTVPFDPATPRHRTTRVVGWVLGAVCSVMAAGPARADTAPSEPSHIVALREQAAGYEHGAGVTKDSLRAVALYCQAARLGDAESQFDLGWMYANGRGVLRDDRVASFFFAAAAEQGIAPARRMLEQVGAADAVMPACMREPVAEAVAPLAQAALAVPFPIRSPAPRALVEMVKRIAPGYRVEPQLALVIIQVESNFDPMALSPKNAKGLMQLIPDTAARFRVKNAYDPQQNIHGGLAYLRWLLAYFEGDLALVAAAYNAGEGTVERYGGVPPYVETRAYVRRVLQGTGSNVHPFDAHVTAPSPRLGLLRNLAIRN